MFRSLIFVGLLIIQIQFSNAQPSLSLSTYNDLWGGGTVPVHDDFRSFGLSSTLNLKKWKIQLDLSGLTNKTAADSFSKKRIDLLAGSIEYELLKKKLFELNLGTGFHYFGRSGADWLQNQTHFLFGVPKVQLPYEKPQICPIFYSKIQSKDFNDENFYTRLESKIGFLSAIYSDIQLRIGWKKNKQIIDFQLGYNVNLPVGPSEVWKKVCEKESGFFIGFRHETEVFNFEWKTWFSSFSQGIISLNIPLQKSDSAQKSNIHLKFGTWLDSEGYYYQLGIPVFKKNNHVKLLISHHFGTLVTKQLASYPDTLGHTRTLGLGLEYFLFQNKRKFYISPFVSGSVGSKTFQIYSDQNNILNQTKLTGFSQIGMVCSLKLPFLNQTIIGFSLQVLFQYVDAPKLIQSELWMKGGGLFVQF